MCLKGLLKGVFMTPQSFRFSGKLAVIGLFTIVSVNLFAGVEIESINYSGTGCPAGSVRAILAPDASALTVLYDRFEARVNNIEPNSKKNCKVILRIKKPKFFSFAVESADFRGFVALSPGVKATQKVNLQTGQGTLGDININLGMQVWQGPINDNFLVKAVKPLNELKYLNCFQPKNSANLEINSVSILENGGVGKEGIIAMDTTDASLVQRYNLKWINCIEKGIGVIGGLFR
jgi:hypothetical protein